MVPVCQKQCLIEQWCMAWPKMKRLGSLGTREWVTPEQSVIAATETTPKGWADLAVCLTAHTSSDTSVKWGDGSLWRSLLRRERHSTRSCYLKYFKNTGKQNGTTRNLTETGHWAVWVSGLFWTFGSGICFCWTCLSLRDQHPTLGWLLPRQSI